MTNRITTDEALELLHQADLQTTQLIETLKTLSQDPYLDFTTELEGLPKLSEQLTRRARILDNERTHYSIIGI